MRLIVHRGDGLSLAPDELVAPAAKQRRGPWRSRSFRPRRPFCRQTRRRRGRPLRAAFAQPAADARDPCQLHYAIVDDLELRIDPNWTGRLSFFNCRKERRLVAQACNRCPQPEGGTGSSLGPQIRF